MFPLPDENKRRSKATAIYGLKYQSRAITAAVSDENDNFFLVGSTSLKGENEIHLINYTIEGGGGIHCEQIFRHPSEIWSLSAHPARRSLFFAVHNIGKISPMKIASLYTLAESDDRIVLNERAQIRTPRNDINSVVWHGGGKDDVVVTIDPRKLRMFQIGTEATEIGSIDESLGNLYSASWDPLHTDCVITANDTALRGWDLRSFDQTFQIPQAHAGGARDVDFNPHVPHVCASGGDDGCVRIWDTRKVETPLQKVDAHTHWVWSVRYNHFHDQFLLTSGSDTDVGLWCFPSLSSERDNKGDVSDGLTMRYDEHEESVYRAIWSATDPYIFASLSFDGRVVINRVPDDVKMKFLVE